MPTQPAGQLTNNIKLWSAASQAFSVSYNNAAADKLLAVNFPPRPLVTGTNSIRDGIFDARLFKRPQAQRATVADAAGNLLGLIARPGQPERRSQCLPP